MIICSRCSVIQGFIHCNTYQLLTQAAKTSVRPILHVVVAETRPAQWETLHTIQACGSWIVLLVKKTATGAVYTANITHQQSCMAFPIIIDSQEWEKKQYCQTYLQYNLVDQTHKDNKNQQLLLPTSLIDNLMLTDVSSSFCMVMQHRFCSAINNSLPKCNQLSTDNFIGSANI